ncbi:hypothetical protein SDC9_168360 [bioreactor metagenome]|jgi:hypothetical protein|uniref:Acid-activated urea channel n=1 Tax=bioreactor metagenome TaxID=1076179 RepID=A0A645G2B7_9ZZZZ
MHPFGEITLGLVGLYIAATLMINLLVMMGHGSPKSVSVLNIFTGLLGVAVALQALFVSGSPMTAAQTLLFALTYLWIGVAYWTGETDFRTFGYYCLFVTINALIFGAYAFASSMPILGVNWMLWAAAWFMFFVFMGIQKVEYFKHMLVVSWITTLVLWVSALGWLIGWFDFSGFLYFP